MHYGARVTDWLFERYLDKLSEMNNHTKTSRDYNKTQISGKKFFILHCIIL